MQNSEYSKYYNKKSFLSKIAKNFKALGKDTAFNLFILNTLLNDKSTPVKVKTIIIAALGYFIFPFDMVNDFIPALGYTDDIALIVYTLKNISKYITPQIREKAMQKILQFSKS